MINSTNILKISVLAILQISALSVHADLVITMGGDVNFNKHLQAPLADRVQLNGSVVSHQELLNGIRPLLIGDLNFANLETVVSDKNLGRAPKTFTFVSHPSGVKAMLSSGFNLMSLANNHQWDAGRQGYVETLKHLADLKSRTNFNFAGLGMNREQALAPTVFNTVAADGKKYVVAFSAISFTDAAFMADANRPGMINLRNPTDLKEFLLALRNTSAHLKIVSVHVGTEGQVTLDSNQLALFHSFIDLGDADLVIGHHPHVVRPIEIYKGRVIFYSLGNYMMPGSADISSRQVGYDYGLHGRVYFDLNPTTRKLQMRAIEAIPLTQVHAKARPLVGAAAQTRIQFLNRLSAKETGANAVQFEILKSGSGLYCAPNPEAIKDRAARLCAGIAPNSRP